MRRARTPSTVRSRLVSGSIAAYRMRSQTIESDLAKAKAKVAKLEQQLVATRASESRGKGKEVRCSRLLPLLSQRCAKLREVLASVA